MYGKGCKNAVFYRLQEVKNKDNRLMPEMHIQKAANSCEQRNLEQKKPRFKIIGALVYNV